MVTASPPRAVSSCSTDTSAPVSFMVLKTLPSDTMCEPSPYGGGGVMSQDSYAKGTSRTAFRWLKVSIE